MLVESNKREDSDLVGRIDLVRQFVRFFRELFLSFLSILVSLLHAIGSVILSHKI